MVGKILSAVRKEYTNIHQAATLLVIFSFISQFVGLIRDRMLVSKIGPSLPLDTYYAAFKIPDIIFVSIGSLVAVTAIMPFFKERLAKSKNDAEEFLASTLSAFLLFVGFISLLAFIFMPVLVYVVAPGFESSAVKELVHVSRIMLLSPILLGFQNLFASITQYHRKFFIFALAPLLYNLGIIFGVIFLYDLLGIDGLAIGVVLGALLHLIIHTITVKFLGYKIVFARKIDWTQIKKVAKLSFPRMMTLTLASLTIFFTTAVASTFSEGSISLLTFAINIMTFPVGLIGLSYAVASFPTLVDTYEKSKQKFIEVFQNVAGRIIFWTIPITMLFIILRAHIVRVVYGTQNLSWADTKALAATFAILSLAITSYSILLLAIRAYYAANNNRKPFIVSMGSLLITIVFTFIFLSYSGKNTILASWLTSLFHIESRNVHILFLGLAYSLGHIVSFIILYFHFRKDFGKESLRPITKCLSETVFASILGGLSTYGTLTLFTPLGPLKTFWSVFLQASLAGLIGSVVVLVILLLLKNNEAISFMASFRKRLKKPVETPATPEETHI